MEDCGKARVGIRFCRDNTHNSTDQMRKTGTLEGLGHLAVNPTLGRWRQEDEKFKVLFSCRGNSRLAWTMRDPHNNKHLRDYVSRVELRLGRI